MTPPAAAKRDSDQRTASGHVGQPTFADRFEVMVFWMSDDPMLQGQTFLLRTGTITVVATIAPIRYRLNLNNLDHLPATKLERSEVGVCSVELSESIDFDPGLDNRRSRGVLLIDPANHNTVGAGLLRFALRRSPTVRWQAHEIRKNARAAAKYQRPCVIWLTGLSGAGKSTIANLVERRLHAEGRHTYLLDGDDIRQGLNNDLGFTDADRVENIRRVAEVARLMLDAGLIVVVAIISPFASERAMARNLVAEDEFFEVFVDAPLELAERRDPKGLYKKARNGHLANFTGINSPYEPPKNPELRLDTAALAPAAAADLVMALLEQRGMLGRASRSAEQSNSHPVAQGPTQVQRGAHRTDRLDARAPRVDGTVGTSRIAAESNRSERP